MILILLALCIITKISSVFFDPSAGVWYIVFKLLIIAFICLWTAVVLYNVYKSKWNPPKYDNIAKLKNYLTWNNFLRLFTLPNIAWFLTNRVYKKLFLLLFAILTKDPNMWFNFMGFLALVASFEYFKNLFEQLSKTDKKDFSLTSSYMQNKFTLNWFILRVCVFCIGYIFIKYII